MRAVPCREHMGEPLDWMPDQIPNLGSPAVRCSTCGNHNDLTLREGRFYCRVRCPYAPLWPLRPRVLRSLGATPGDVVERIVQEMTSEDPEGDVEDEPQGFLTD